jgi:peptidoglycan/LPS O-acetylase OafA/YrhL
VTKDSLIVKNPKLNLIQFFRGFSALLIVMFHASYFSIDKFHQTYLSNIFSFGYSGVDFFFVLSGFIIFYTSGHHFGQKSKLATFLWKRLIRIYPIYWLITLAVGAIYFLIPSFGTGSEGQIGEIFKSLILYPQEKPPILVVGWALRHIVLFYLVFGLGIWLKPRLSIPIIFSYLGLTLALFIAQILGVFDIKSIPYGWQFLLDSFNLEFAFGCLAAYSVNKFKAEIPNQVMLGIFGAGLLMFAIGAFLFPDPSVSYIKSARIIAYGLSSLVIIIGATLIDIHKSVGIWKIFDYLGNASYSIFLVHVPLLSANIKIASILHLDKLIGQFLTMTLVVVIAIGMGCLLYSYVEKPLLEFLRKRVS